jgi:hypothetical protein
VIILNPNPQTQQVAAELRVPDIVVQHIFGSRTYKMERLLRDAASVPGGFAPACRDLSCLVSSWDGTFACAASATEWDVEWRREEIPGESGGVQVQRAVQPLQPTALGVPPPSEGGAVFFVQCLSANNGGSAHFFDTFMMQRQMDACGLVKTARMGRCVLPVRVRMGAFWYATSLSTREAESTLTRMCPFLPPSVWPRGVALAVCVFDSVVGFFVPFTYSAECSAH